MSDTTVRCWGSNGDGLLGNGSANAGARQESAVAVPGLSGVTQVSVGSSIACALDSSGTVWCWGLGSPGGALKPTPVKLDLSLADLGVRQVAAAGDFACAVTWGGRVFCWGSNDNAQLGRGLLPSPGSHLEPGLVQCISEKAACATLTGVVGVYLAADHVCAITAASEMPCWGSGDHGQIGIPSLYPFGYATKAQWIRTADQKFRLNPAGDAQAARKLTCYTRKAGVAMTCFGLNPVLGSDWVLTWDGEGFNGSGFFTGSPYDYRAGRFAVGDRYLCAIADGGRVSCSGPGLPQTDPVDGKNLTSGAIAIGTSDDALPSPFTSDSFTCVLTSAGGVRCWGYNLRGEAGGPGQFRTAAGDVPF